MLMQPLGYKPRLLNTFFAVMIGYLANLAVPRLGEVLKCTLLARYEKVPADKLVGTIVAERAFDVVFLAIIFLLTLILQYEIVSHYYASLVNKLFVNNGTVSIKRILIFIVAIIMAVIGLRWFLSRYKHKGFVISIKKIFNGIAQGLVSVKYLENKSQFILASAGIWILYLAGTWLGFYATRGTESLGVDVAISALAFGSIGMIITPGGFGSYALLVALILTRNDIPNEIALANGNLQWFAQFIIVLLVGFLSLGLLPYFNKHSKIHESNHNHSPEDVQT